MARKGSGQAAERVKRGLNIYPKRGGHLSVRLVAFYLGVPYLFNINAGT